MKDEELYRVVSTATEAMFAASCALDDLRNMIGREMAEATRETNAALIKAGAQIDKAGGAYVKADRGEPWASAAARAETIENTIKNAQKGEGGAAAKYTEEIDDQFDASQVPASEVHWGPTEEAPQKPKRKSPAPPLAGYMTIGDASERVDIHFETLRTWSRQGILTCRRHIGYWYLPLSEIGVLEQIKAGCPEDRYPTKQGKARYVAEKLRERRPGLAEPELQKKREVAARKRQEKERQAAQENGQADEKPPPPKPEDWTKLGSARPRGGLFGRMLQ